MLRAVLFFIKIAIIVAIAVWLADRPGAVVIEWQGWVVETTVGILLAAVVLFIAERLVGLRRLAQF